MKYKVLRLETCLYSRETFQKKFESLLVDGSWSLKYVVMKIFKRIFTSV